MLFLFIFRLTRSMGIGRINTITSKKRLDMNPILFFGLVMDSRKQRLLIIACIHLLEFQNSLASCTYKIYGYKGKQVRDNIHAKDLVRAIDCFVRNPKPGEVYNMGGGQHCNVSVLEALNFMKIKDFEYVDEPRKGDHQWYISDVSKFKRHYPGWNYQYNLWAIMEDLK